MNKDALVEYVGRQRVLADEEGTTERRHQLAVDQMRNAGRCDQPSKPSCEQMKSLMNKMDSLSWAATRRKITDVFESVFDWDGDGMYGGSSHMCLLRSVLIPFCEPS